VLLQSIDDKRNNDNENKHVARVTLSDDYKGDDNNQKVDDNNSKDHAHLYKGGSHKDRPGKLSTVSEYSPSINNQ